MVDAVASDLAVEGLKFVAKQLIGRATDAMGFRDQFKKLKTKLEYVEALLEDLGCSKEKTQSKLFDTWLNRVKEVTYLAENVMDDYDYEILRRKSELNNRRCNKYSPKRIPLGFKIILFNFRMASKVRGILSEFDEVDDEAQKMGLRAANVAIRTAQSSVSDGNANNVLNQAREHACADAAGFIGRMDDEEILLQKLFNPTTDLSTVAIVGMGGLGKTTLARHIYGHHKTGAHFGSNKMWVSVSQNFDTLRILNQMVESLTSVKGDLSNTDGVIRQLGDHLKGKKFLLVLDDVWVDDRQLWDGIKESVKRIGGQPGSVILVTTRNNEVAEAVGVGYQHHLKRLSDDESWTLFTQNASSGGTVDAIARRIVDKCMGVPLALKVMGGLLQSKQHPQEWQDIEESELWNLPTGHNHILPSLLLSYTNLLTPSLKQCLASYAVVPKGWYLYKTELIGFWLAQGCLHTSEDTHTSSEIGEHYIKILVNNSLLEEVEGDEDEPMYYMMHDLVHDVAVYVSGRNLVTKEEDLSRKRNSRQFTLISRSNKLISESLIDEVLRKFHTVLFRGDVPWNLLNHARYLHTLFLGGNHIIELPSSIDLLKHLRYLQLSDNPIQTLPDSMGKLYQLQTLSLNNCLSLKKLPKELNNLVNLRYIWTTSTMSACKGLVQLTKLQVLPCLALDRSIEGWTIDELGQLHDLRDEIGITGLECVEDKESATKAGLAQKKKVSKLTLAWSKERDEVNEYNDEDVLDALRPHQNIKLLTIQNFYGQIFPSWLKVLNSLTVVKLLNCRRCQYIPTLGHFPLLKCLILNGFDVECIGSEFYGDNSLDMTSAKSFPSLRELEISGFEKLTTWMHPPRPTTATVFPCLEILRVINCHILKSIPVMQIERLRTLKLYGLWSLEHLDILKYTTTLTSLLMNGLDEIKRLPEELTNYAKLEELEMIDFPKVTFVPGGLGTLVSLRTLNVQHCNALICLADDFFNRLSSLREFRLINCRNLTMLLPRSLKGCVSLESLFIYGCPLVEPSPSDFTRLINLIEFHVGCKNGVHLRSMLEALKHLPHLTDLGIEGYRYDEEMKEYFSDMSPFLCLPSLTILVLYGQPSIKTLPHQLGLLTQITRLCISGFPDLEDIPDWIHNLSSLEILDLHDCIKLKRIPSKQVLKHLPQLYFLQIEDCPILVERYTKDNRGSESEWHNIQHLRLIWIDGCLIQDLPE